MDITAIFYILALVLCSSASVDSFCCKTKNWTRWNKNTLTYRIHTYPSQYRREYTDFVFRRAFDLWSQNSDGIKFVQVPYGKVDINIRFDRTSEHAMFRSKEAISFSFPPGPHEYNGDMIFNCDIKWKIDGSERDILKRIVYEIGIAIGLEQNDRQTSVMNPKKKGFSRQLDEIDRKELQDRYGGKALTSRAVTCNTL